MKKKVLVLNGEYLPGYKGGGPIQSIANMVENLSNKFEFYILCFDRDLNEKESYKNIKINEWNKVGLANVYYLNKEKYTMKDIANIINFKDWDVVYLNGFFSPNLTIKPLLLRKLKKINPKKIILTSRGDFTGGCESKKIKKNIYIILSKILGIYKNIEWHATSEMEKKDILKKFPNAKIHVVANLPKKIDKESITTNKKNNSLNCVFISRIFPKKNIKYALNKLSTINDINIRYDIYGPIEDKTYWVECLEIIKRLPKNITVEYKGELKHVDVAKTFNEYDLFLFPTLGENYGHVIIESISNGCPCVLPFNVTPWDDYLKDNNLGFSFDDDNLKKILRRLYSTTNTNYKKIVNNGFDYLMSKINMKELLNKYNEMLGE